MHRRKAERIHLKQKPAHEQEVQKALSESLQRFFLFSLSPFSMQQLCVHWFWQHGSSNIEHTQTETSERQQNRQGDKLCDRKTDKQQTQRQEDRHGNKWRESGKEMHKLRQEDRQQTETSEDRQGDAQTERKEDRQTKTGTPAHGQTE